MAVAEQDKPRVKLGTNAERMIDTIGEILGLLTIALIAFLYIEAQWPFLPTKLAGVLWVIREYAIIIVVALKGMELILKRNSFILFIIYAALVAVAIIFSFFPETGASLINSIQNLR